MTTNLTKEDVQTIIEKHESGTLTEADKEIIENTKLSDVMYLSLYGVDYYAFLNVYATVCPRKFCEAIVKGDKNLPDGITLDRLITFLSFYPKHIQNVAITVSFERNIGKFMSFLGENINLFDENLLPKFLKNDPSVRSFYDNSETLRKQDKLFVDYDENWLHKDTKQLIRLFSINGEFKFTKKSDYLELAKEYYESHLTRSDFCKSHKISNEHNFSAMLNQVEKEAKIKEDNAEATEKSLKKDLKKLGKEIIDGTLTFEEYLEKKYKTSHTLALFREALGADAGKFDAIISKQMYDYITRDDCNVNTAKLSTLFGLKFRFITSLEAYGVAEVPLEKAINNYIKFGDPKLISRIIKGSSQQYIASDYEGSITIDGTTYEITKQDRRDTLIYMVSKDIFISQRSYDYYLMQIAMGNIQVDKGINPTKK